MDPKCNNQYPSKREILPEEEEVISTEVEIGVSNHKPRKAGSHQSWKRRGTDSPLRPPEDVGPYRELDFGPVKLISELLVSRSMRE